MTTPTEIQETAQLVVAEVSETSSKGEERRWPNNPLVGHVLVFLTVLVAAFSAYISNLSLHQTLDQQQEIKAYETWERFAEVSLENSDVSGLTFAQVENDKVAKFDWYMERFLIASEQIIISAERDRQWELAIYYEVSPRYEWFLSDEFLGKRGEANSLRDSFLCTYISGLRRVVAEGILVGYAADSQRAGLIREKYGISDGRDLKDRINQTESNCVYPDEPQEDGS